MYPQSKMSSSNEELDDFDKETLERVKKVLLEQKKRKEKAGDFVQPPRKTRKNQKAIEQQKVKELQDFNDQLKKHNNSLKQYNDKMEDFHVKTTKLIKSLVQERDMLMKKDKALAEEAKAFDNMTASGVLKGELVCLCMSFIRLLLFFQHYY